MFNDWFKAWGDPFSYDTWKKNVVEFNQKVINFWKDFYNDIQSNLKNR